MVNTRARRPRSLVRLKSDFEKKVAYIPFYSCQEWLGYLNPGGYGQFQVGGKARIAARVSYELYKGKIPEGTIVCHSCDNPACVNPEHLWLGTYKDNMVDMISKGRGKQQWGKRT